MFPCPWEIQCFTELKDPNLKILVLLKCTWYNFFTHILFSLDLSSPYGHSYIFASILIFSIMKNYHFLWLVLCSNLVPPNELSHQWGFLPLVNFIFSNDTHPSVWWWVHIRRQDKTDRTWSFGLNHVLSGTGRIVFLLDQLLFFSSAVQLINTAHCSFRAYKLSRNKRSWGVWQLSEAYKCHWKPLGPQLLGNISEPLQGL